MLTLLGEVTCPRCEEPVRIWCNPEEITGNCWSPAPRCPECRHELTAETFRMVSEMAVSS